MKARFALVAALLVLGPVETVAVACSSNPAPAVVTPTDSPTATIPAAPTPDATTPESFSPDLTETTDPDAVGMTVDPEVYDTTADTSGGFRCRDGSMSHAKHRRGACSHHGGIA